MMDYLDINSMTRVDGSGVGKVTLEVSNKGNMSADNGVIRRAHKQYV